MGRAFCDEAHRLTAWRHASCDGRTILAGFDASVISVRFDRTARVLLYDVLKRTQRQCPVPTTPPNGNHRNARPTRRSSPPREERNNEKALVPLAPVSKKVAPSPGSEPLPAKQQRVEIARIVRRLEAIVINHLEGARRIHYPLSLEQVLAIIDALQAEAEGKSRPVAFSNGEVMFYLMDGLYEELLGEPSNIFLSTPLAEGGIRFEPLQRDFWLVCLEGLRQRMDRLRLEAP